MQQQAQARQDVLAEIKRLDRAEGAETEAPHAQEQEAFSIEGTVRFLRSDPAGS